MSSSPDERSFDGSEPSSDSRLDSWKEIAGYLRRSVRSARRWEHEQALPIRRHDHGKGDSVYAFKGELDAWWENRGGALADNNVVAVVAARNPKRAVVAALIAFFAIAIVALITKMHPLQAFARPRSAPQQMTMERLPLDWLGYPAISQDGRLVAYSTRGNARNTIRLRQLQGGGEVELTVADEGAFMSHPVFSRDGNWLYYVQASRPNADAADQLRRVSLLGGPPQTVVDLPGRLDWVFALSPDGNRLAYDRWIRGKSTVVIANQDGSSPHDLVSFDKPENLGSMSWSPNGTKLLVVIQPWGVSYPAPQPKFNLAFVDVNTGAIERRLPYSRYELWRAEWLPDGTGFVAVRDGKRMSYFSYPALHMSPIETGNKQFWAVRVGNRATFVAVQNASSFGLWVIDLDKPASMNQITTGQTTSDGESGVTWTADNRIVYSSEDTATKSASLWARDPDGGNARQLTRAGPNTYDKMPNASPDGRYILFDETRVESGQATSSRIFRVRSDGGDPVPLTPANQSCEMPFFASDGKSILFTEWKPGGGRLMKMSGLGGRAAEVRGERPCNTGWGSDRAGKWIACCHKTVEYARKPVEFVMAISDGKVKWEKATGAKMLRWTRDGELSYVQRALQPSNVFVQPLDGRPEKQITNFETGIIGDIAWSPDGRKLVIARQLTAREAYLLKNVPISEFAQK